MTTQLTIPISDIDRRDESPRHRKCYQAKKRWEDFMRYRFALDPSSAAYRAMFPRLAAFDIERADYKALEAFATFFDEAREVLRKQIFMYGGHYYDFADLPEDEQYQALQHWVEWCDIFHQVSEEGII